MTKNKLILSLSVLFFCLTAQVYAVFIPDIEVINRNAPLFPHMLFNATIENWKRTETTRPYWVYTQEELANKSKMAEYQISMLLNNDILAYYGHPGSRNMGILGRHSIEELDHMLTELAKEYEAAGGKKIRKAFYLIYGTVWPQGEIGIMRDSMLMPFIEYGLENDILVFVDHQIGRYDPIDSLKKILPWLRYPNVHLALDPEWRTDKPMEVIGHMRGDEVNTAQQVMEDNLIQHNLPGERMLVIHQFNHIMIRNRHEVRTNYNRVRLIHCMDGIGTPQMKLDTYEFNSRATNMPLKSFKLFYDLKIPGAGVDRPLMTPKQVYALEPRPLLIMYQ
jgi:hypothetical protein